MSTAMATRVGAASKDLNQQRILNELAVYTGWLSTNGVRGVISEIGWPQSGADQQQWNRTATRWIAACNRANLPIMFFAAQGPGVVNSSLTMYTRASGTWPSTDIGAAHAGAPVVEANMTRGNVWRGVHMFGPDANDSGGSGNNPANYNNTNPGTYGTSWWYETQGSYNYLASRGATVVRIPFEWERIQATLNSPLVSAELARLQSAVTMAGNAGLKAVLDCHCYAAYEFSSGRAPIGSGAVPISAFVDLWARMSAAFAGNTNVLAYSLANEPHDLPTSLLGGSGARTWEAASQAALSAIRGGGDTAEVHVSVYEWGHGPFVTKNHPKAWLVDPANNIRYEAHHYLYLNRASGPNYPDPYATEVAGCRHLWSHYMNPGATWATLSGLTWAQL